MSKLWERFLESRRGTPVGIPTAIYDQYESDHHGACRVTIADELEDGCAPSVTVPEGWYLRCVACGPQPAALLQAWEKIRRLSDEGKIQRSYKADYEVYVSPSRVEVYVALERSG